MPLASKILPLQKTFSAVSSFFVRVPVLSEQITLVLPSVSTADIFLASAFFFAIAFMPSASVIVTTAASPSGTAATARLTAVKNISFHSFPAIVPVAKTAMQTSITAIPIFFPKSSIVFSNGVFSFSIACIRLLIFPNSVFMPVDVTSAVPLP